jgi:hypothetical protein
MPLTFGQAALAQEVATIADAQPNAARKVDEYGKIGHCDMSARLDNLAMELQNEPQSKALIVGYDRKGEAHSRADWYLKVSRFYLINSRGIEPSRVAIVNGGSRDGKDVVTELWLVPDGAEPPVPMPATDKYAAKDFSGKFDSYVTDDQIYREIIEMGYSGTEISQSEFAEKMKEQPDSNGYLVIRTSKKSVPGAWRRIARREEQLLQKDYNIEARRLKSVNGGQIEGDYAEVQLWILPKSAPPPAGVKEQSEQTLKESVRLNRLDDNGSADEDAEKWMLENIAEALRDNPRASVCLVAREPLTVAIEEWSDDSVVAETASAPQLPIAEKTITSPADPKVNKEDASEESETEVSMKERAERWKKILTTKYGIYSWRIVVLEGKESPWGGGRLTTWLVPENARWPDPLALDEDEVEEGSNQESVVKVEPASEPSQPPPL